MKNGKCRLVNQVTGVSILEQRKSSIRKTCDVIFMVFLFAVEGYPSYDRAKRCETTFKGYQVTQNHFDNLQSLNTPFVRLGSLLMISYEESVLALFA